MGIFCGVFYEKNFIKKNNIKVIYLYILVGMCVEI